MRSDGILRKPWKGEYCGIVGEPRDCWRLLLQALRHLQLRDGASQDSDAHAVGQDVDGADSGAAECQKEGLEVLGRLGGLGACRR